MIARALAETVLRDALAACDPARRVREALAAPAVAARLAGRRRLAIAIGKAALAMARGAGEVAAGVAVVPAAGAHAAGAHAAGAHAAGAHAAGAHAAGGADPAPSTRQGLEAALPPGWQVLEAPHPEPDERSVAAGAAVAALVAGAGPGDAILALLSGGASSLVEQPLVALDELVATVGAVMAAGAAIDEINAVRGALSALKAGQLALAAAAPVVTLAISDVIGDPLAVIGSGPTVGPWLASPGVAVDDGASARRRRAREVLARHGVPAPALLAHDLAARTVARDDHARVIAPMATAAHAAVRALAARGLAATLVEAPVADDVEAVAGALARRTDLPLVAWGEPTVRIPPRHGTGGRAQQLALVLARHLRGTARSALVVGTDGVDGPPPPDRPSPAGAWVDGATWDAIAATGRDPDAALAACDAGAALHAVGALVVTGATGVNHADLVILG